MTNKKKYKGELDKDPSYCLTLFKIKDHRLWRANLNDNQEAFEKMYTHPENKRPDIIEKKIIKIDRLTGEVNEVK